MDEVGGHPIFQRWTGRSWSWGPNDSYEGFFGGEVLRGLTDGLDHFLDSEHWSRRRKPCVVGCTPWLTDGAVVERLMRFSECCIVINKPELVPDDLRSFDAEIRHLHEAGRGLNRDLLRGIDSTTMAPKFAGEPVTLGPSGPYTDCEPETVFQSVRVAGIRKTDGRTIPLAHAKLLLVGFAGWTDEHPSGYAVEHWWFEPRRLWLGSTNFTFNARRSLEFGIWVDDLEMLRQATEFLTDLLAYSEPWGSKSVWPDPELAPYDYDEEAMWEAVREMRFYDEPDSDDEH